jgi:dynein heavy chain 1
MYIKPLVHEVRIRNQVIYLDPPMELARQEWLYQFQDALGMYLSIKISSADDIQVSSAISFA